jgi:GT2 family glycosyltransferase/tetratricopeptide (TPR) repeat protein
MKTNTRNNRDPLVSVVIPVFNKCALTLQCLESMERVQTQAPYEVIVVDNASSDGSAARVTQAAPDVRVIRNEVNGGFARACNQGAATSRGKYVLFLNNDTILLQGWMDELVRELQTQPKVAVVGSKLLYGSGLVQHAGVIFGRESRSPYHPYRMLHADDPRVNHRRELSAVTAACMLIRAKWFQDCGGFCEEYRNGYEDLDLCLTIRRKGGVIVYQPRSTLIHLESQTPGRFGHDAENRSKFFQRWGGAILSDEDAFFFQDNYRVGATRDAFPEAPQLIPLRTEEERRQWSTVARAQTLAAEWSQEEVRAILCQADAWPKEYRVRRWAGIVCHKLGLREAACSHFQAATAETPDTELSLYLSDNQQGPDPIGHADAMTWGGSLRLATQAIKSGQFESAQDHLETALQEGGPLKLILPAMAQCARALGAYQQVEVAMRAAKNIGATRSNEEPAAFRVSSAERASKVQPNLTAQPTPSDPIVTGQLTSIIVLVRDQLEHTQACLESLEQHTPEKHELILVDNGSASATASWLAQYATSREEVTLIRNESNRGFAAGNNQGFAVARGDTILLLNNDTIVTPGWLKRMIKALQDHPATGIVGPRSNRVAGAQLVPEPGYRNTSELPTFAREWAQKNAGQCRETPRVIGFCLLLRRSVLETVGALDEQYGSGNFEDDDFCIRAGIAGYKAMIVDDSFVHHVGGQTFRGAGIDYRQSMLKNWQLFKTKWDLSPTAPIEQGYRVPVVLPTSARLREEIPDLKTTHCWDAKSRSWKENSPARSEPGRNGAIVGLQLPPCALLGHLAEARDLFGKKQFQAAWRSTLQRIAERPFHPEAYLLLAQIADAAGDGEAAIKCARHASLLAPGWKAPTKFLKARHGTRCHPSWLEMPAGLAQAAPRLSVCLIARNEEKFLPQCLESVRGLAEQIVVVDTGSTDRTIEIAKEHGAEVFHFSWCDDFSAARNVALENAHSDWVLMLDADEVLLPESHDRIRKLMNERSVMAWRLPIIDVGREDEGCSYVPRLFRNAPALFYVGRVHEQVFGSIEVVREPWGLGNRLGDGVLRHYGYTQAVVRDRNKIERNLKLLEKAIHELPDEPSLLMNYGLELVRSGRREDGLQQYFLAYSLMSELPDAQVVPECREMLLTQISTHLLADNRLEEIVRILSSSLARKGGLTGSLHFTLGLALMRLEKYAEAGDEMRRCIAKRDQPALAPINKEIRGIGPRHCLAMCLAKAGRHQEANQAFLDAITEAPKSKPVRLDYAKYLITQLKPVEALQLLHGVIAESPNDDTVWKLGAEVALSRPEFIEVAEDWTAEARRHLPEDRVIRSQAAEALMLAGKLEEARDLWRPLPATGAAPSQLAALILCEVALGKPQFFPENDREPAVSMEFIRWYQKLIKFGADKLIFQLNASLGTLAAVLPSAARMLHAAMAEADAQPA